MKSIKDRQLLLQDILDEESKKLFSKLTFDKIVIYRKSKKWVLYFNSEQYIDSLSLKRMGKCIKEQVGTVDDVVVRACYPWNENFFMENYELIWRDILTEIQKEMPSCIPWLDNCKSIYKEDKINIYIDNQIAYDFLKAKNIESYISKYLDILFDRCIKVDIKFTGREDEELCEKVLLQRENEVRKIVEKYTCNIDVSKTGNTNNSTNATNVIFGKKFEDTPIEIADIDEESGKVTVEGTIFDMNIRQTRSGKYIFILYLTDYTNSIVAKLFSSKEKAKPLMNKLKIGSWVRLKGECIFDNYQRELVIMIENIIKMAKKERMDLAEQKRVELHLHTNMSSMDATASTKSLVERAAKWGHRAIAITDHGVVQAFPEAYIAGKENDIKILFGVEGYLIDDCKPIVMKSNQMDFNQTFIVLDIETTGLNPKQDKITEIGAIKIKNLKEIDSFQAFVNPGIPIPQKIIELTGITDDMVRDAGMIEEILPEFKEFVGDGVLVAHNASFDMGFIRYNAKKLNIEFKNPLLDTLALSRALFKDLKKHKLDVIARHLDVDLENHHRALDDARATGKILIKMIDIMLDMGVNTLNEINTHISADTNLNSLRSHHMVLLAQTQEGLKNLYTLISHSHIDYFYRRPRIPKSLLARYREGIILGSACEAGELFSAILDGEDDDMIREIVEFYDYLEIQPLANNEFYIRQGRLKSLDELKEINRKIVQLGEQFDKPVVATGDVHFLDPHDEYFRRILMSGQGFSDADNQAPLYLKTTEEMLEEFSYLGEEKCREVVIYNPNKIADTIDELEPFPCELHSPEIPGADREIKNMSINRAKSIYGDPLPQEVAKRLEKELTSIINNGYAVLYLIAHKLVKKSLEDGYLVGSRGSVGSSFVATLTDITEVNPLPPHYVCPTCKHSDFDIDIIQYGCGIDLPDKPCPKCGTMYIKDGFDIPFEVFLGFKGDKIPDIDLNFSGEYQSNAHKYTEELFGEGHVFRAGTIGTIADKTAFGFVKKYLDEKEIYANSAEIKRLVKGCTGVKRTTGQHPGGVMVVPKGNDIHEFTPIQHPADSKDSGIITTHFDYNAISDTLVKLDILGHDDPTVIRMLEDITGIDATEIPLDEPETMKIFSSTESLGVTPEQIGSVVGTYGIPEFGTKFVRQMLIDTKPTTFSELIRISGLSHGTDVWLNNAQILIRDGIAELSEVICTRDDIMIYLLYKGLEPTDAFTIMENVRRGKGLTEEFEKKMVKNNVPEWFIDSCKKIKYMFPKAHAAAYVLMAYRIAYFKVHYPEAFYAVYFTVKADDCDIATILKGRESIEHKLKELENKGNDATAKEKGLITVLEVALEMACRDINMLPVDLYSSDAVRFELTEKGILPPLSSLQGISANVAKSIVTARAERPFLSIEDLRNRTKVSKSAVEILKENNVLEGIPETSQISLF